MDNGLKDRWWWWTLLGGEAEGEVTWASSPDVPLSGEPAFLPLPDRLDQLNLLLRLRKEPEGRSSFFGDPGVAGREGTRGRAKRNRLYAFESVFNDSLVQGKRYTHAVSESRLPPLVGVSMVAAVEVGL
jgi:hypothetical protein